MVDDPVRAALIQAWSATHAAPPTPEELRDLVGRWVDQEVMYREGVRRGFADNDPQVRDRVADQMKYALEQGATVPDPTDAELRAWFEANKAKFQRPGRIDFTQVFVEGEDEAATTRAKALLVLLEDGAQPAGLGDMFAGGRRFRGRKLADLGERFGAAFATGLDSEPVETWTLRRSSFGLHLVRVDRAVLGSAPTFDLASRERVSQAGERSSRTTTPSKPSYPQASSEHVHVASVSHQQTLQPSSESSHSPGSHSVFPQSSSVQLHVPSSSQVQVLQPSSALVTVPGLHSSPPQPSSVQLQLPLSSQVQVLQPSAASITSPASHSPPPQASSVQDHSPVVSQKQELQGSESSMSPGSHVVSSSSPQSSSVQDQVPSSWQVQVLQLPPSPGTASPGEHAGSMPQAAWMSPQQSPKSAHASSHQQPPPTPLPPHSASPSSKQLPV